MENFVRNLFGRKLCVENVFLEESVLAIHVSAVEETIAVHDLVPVVLADVLREVVLLVFYVVLVALDVLFGGSARGRQSLSFLAFGLKAERAILSLHCFGLSGLAPLLIVKGSLQPA